MWGVILQAGEDAGCMLKLGMRRAHRGGRRGGSGHRLELGTHTRLTRGEHLQDPRGELEALQEFGGRDPGMEAAVCDNGLQATAQRAHTHTVGKLHSMLVRDAHPTGILAFCDSTFTGL